MHKKDKWVVNHYFVDAIAWRNCCSVLETLDIIKVLHGKCYLESKVKLESK